MKKRLRPVGKIVKAAGLKGNVKIFPLVPEFETLLESGKFGLQMAGALEFIKMTPVRKSGRLFHFNISGISTREEAEGLVGKMIYLEVDSDVILPEDIIGFDIYTTDGRWIGELTEVLHMPAHDVYVIDYDDREVLIPAVNEIVRDIDIENRIIFIFPMEGLLD